MSRERKYKVWDKDNKQWVELAGDVFITYAGGIFQVIDGDEFDARVLENVEIVDYTGLNDNTPWDKLTLKELTEFYNSKYSEDGETIKYVDFTSVKHLWRGKEIYEGDIIKRIYDFYKPGAVTIGVVKFVDGAFILDPVNKNEEGDYLFTEVAYNVKIGSIYENPELMEG